MAAKGRWIVFDNDGKDTAKGEPLSVVLGMHATGSAVKEVLSSQPGEEAVWTSLRFENGLELRTEDGRFTVWVPESLEGKCPTCGHDHAS